MPFILRKKNIPILENIVIWNRKVINLLNEISERNFIRQDRLLEFWCEILSGKDFLNCQEVGVWLFSKENEEIAYCTYSKDIQFHSVHRNTNRLDISNSIISNLLSIDNTFYVLNDNEIDQSGNWLPSINISHAMLLKIFSENKCIGFIEFCNQYKRKDDCSLVLSSKGFSWITDTVNKPYGELINNLLNVISKKIGYTLTKVKQAEVIKQYVADLVAKNPQDKISLFNAIKDNVIELTGASHFTFWIYDKDVKKVMLSYLYGNTSKNPDETVLNINDSWLGFLIDKNQDNGYLDLPSSYDYYHSSWIDSIGDIPVAAFSIRHDNNEIYGIATLHFESATFVNKDIFDKTALYFKMITTILNAFRNRIEKDIRLKIHKEFSTWMNEIDLSNFYKKLILIARSIFKNCECSIFLRDKRRLDVVKLIESTSALLKDKIGKDIYYLESKQNELFGITGHVFTNINYPTLFYRIKDHSDYSGGRCDEIIANGNVSVMYGRLIFNDLIFGSIRCVSRNEFLEVNNNSRNYVLFDKDDESTIEYISFLGSMILKLLLYTADEKEKIQELEHETITPISIVIHEIDGIDYKINKLMNLSSKELGFKLNSNSFQDLSLPVWNDPSIAEFEHWTYRLRIAKFEAELTSALLRSPNVVDFPVEKYNFEKIHLLSLIVPIFHSADYLATIKNRTLKKFKAIFKDIKNNNFLVRIDRTMFNQAFLHVIDNAIKYGFNLEYHKKADYDVWFDVKYLIKENINFFRLSICNFGDPIPIHEREIIFKKNVSGEYAKKSKKAGKGLGLYVAKSIMQNFGGDIAINFEENSFVEFYLEIPLL
jgi:signal transduction histidine kinase